MNIEEITTQKSIMDLFKDVTLSPEKKMLTIFPDDTYCMRLIGPTVSAKRIFLNKDLDLQKYITTSEFIGLINNNSEVMQFVSNRILNLMPEKLRQVYLLKQQQNKNEFMGAPEGTKIEQIMGLVKSLFDKEKGKWQRCVMSNIYLKSSTSYFDKDKMRIVCLTRSMCNDLFNRMDKQNTKNLIISGICANDMIISRKSDYSPSVPRRKFDRAYELSVSEKPTSLNIYEVGYILSEGLTDIHKIANILNDRASMKLEGFYYLTENYKMPEEILKSFCGELSNFDILMENEAIENNIDQISQMAFENHQSNNSVEGLEV